MAGDPRQFWTNAGRTPTLEPGTVLRAREVEDETDPYALVVVVGTHWVPKGEEAVIQPLSFGEAISAPVNGAGSLLAHFDVLTETEVAALREAE